MTRSVRTRPDRNEVRARILEVAEDQFRRTGYQKTSVADIARASRLLQQHGWCGWLQLLHMQLLHGQGPACLLLSGHPCAQVHHLLLLLGSCRAMVVLRHVQP